MTKKIGAFVRNGKEDRDPNVNALAEQVERVLTQDFKGQAGGINVDLRQAQGGGTGAHMAGSTITVDVPAPASGWQPPNLNPDYQHIVQSADKALIWDNILFELRNVYNRSQFDTAKQVGLYKGTLQAGGEAKADVECVTLVLYLRDIQTALKKVQQQRRLAFANDLSAMAKRTIMAVLGLPNVQPATLFAWFRATPHGGAAAQPGSRQALQSDVMYAVERVEGWNSKTVEDIIVNRVARAAGITGSGPQGALRPVVQGVMQGRGYQPGDTNPPNFVAPQNTVTVFDAVIADFRQAHLANPGTFHALLTSIGLSGGELSNAAGKLAEVDAALQDVRPTQAIVTAAAAPSLPVGAPGNPNLAQQQVANFVTCPLPKEEELTAVLNATYGATAKFAGAVKDKPSGL